MAHHRGSSFGGDLFNPQPKQATFENRLALGFQKTPFETFFLVEDESRRIGQINLPSPIKEKMNESPVVILESPIHCRVELIFDGYIREPMLRGKSKEDVRDHMVRQLDIIHKQLGGALHSDLRKSVLVAFENETRLEFHEEWIRNLLLRHYDPRYRYAFNRQNRKVLFQGEFWACHQFLILWNQDLAQRNQKPEMVRA
jgi:tRNA 2-selenouridine synthase